MENKFSKNKHFIRHDFLVPGVLLVATIISGAILRSSYIYADDSVVDSVTVAVPASCTMTGSGTATHTTEIFGGNYRADIGTTTINAVCNDGAGFSIYAAGYTGDTIGSVNSNKLIGVGTNIAIDTGLSETGNTSNWAMKLATNSEATYPLVLDSDANGSFGNYHIVPNGYTKVAHRNSGTDAGTGATGSDITTTYAVYVSTTQAADTYVGQVKYVMVHPQNANAPAGTEIMQNVSEWGNTVEVGQEIVAIDARDGKTYTVARLADGNLWMTQNLDHDIKTDGSVTYDNTTTDLGYNTVTGQYDTASWVPSNSTIATADANLWEGKPFAPRSYDPGNYYWNGVESDFNGWLNYLGSCTWDETNLKYTNCDESLNLFSNYTSLTGNSHYHLGNYYNWTAAVAMNDSSGYTTDGTIIEQSICPTGWTLPRGSTSYNNYKDLWDEYGFTNYSYEVDQYNNRVPNGSALWTQPLSFNAGGGFDGFVAYIGSCGFYWSSVVHNGDLVYDAGFATDGRLFLAGDGYRFDSSAVRCIARPTN